MGDQRTDSENGDANESWVELKVGDLIRMVRMPTGYSRENCSEDTLLAYQYLIDRGLLIRVAYLKEWENVKYPWIEFELRCSDGQIEYHSLMINHDGWVRVSP